MPAIMPASIAPRQKTPCPHCGKAYRTLLKRQYGVAIDAGIKQSIAMGSQWRCLGCGKSYVTADE